MKGLGFKIYSMAFGLSIMINMFIALGTYAQEMDTKDLEGYWKFDEGTGTTVTDHSDKGRDLSVVGNSNWVEGKMGKAFEFDGVTVLKMDGSNQIRAGNLTISMHIKLQEFPASDTGANILIANDGIAALGQGAVDFGFFGGILYSYVPGMKWDMGDRVAGQTDFTALLDTWRHVAVVYNQDYNETIGKSFVYVDGKLDGSAELTMTLGGDIILGFPESASFPQYNVSIGGYRDDTGNVLRSVRGAIDELMIFSRALNDEEIARLAQVGQSNTGAAGGNQPSAGGLTDEIDKEKEENQIQEEGKVDSPKEVEQDTEKSSVSNTTAEQKQGSAIENYTGVLAVITVMIIASATAYVLHRGKKTRKKERVKDNIKR